MSDHENGIDAASIAYMLGASIWETFTNGSWKVLINHFLEQGYQGDQKFKWIPNFSNKDKKFLKSEKNYLKWQKKLLPKQFFA